MPLFHLTSFTPSDLPSTLDSLAYALLAPKITLKYVLLFLFMNYEIDKNIKISVLLYYYLGYRGIH